MTHDVDIAVIGGGAAGMIAALRAARNPDLTIAVFEKSTVEGCNTQVSSGSLAAGGTRFQEAAGIEDSPQRHADDILAVSKDEDSRPYVEAMCAVAPDFVHWLADDLDHPMEIGGDMRRGGMSVPRLHTDVGRNGGQVLVRTLRRAIEAQDNIAFVDQTPGVGLLSDDTAVTGVRVQESSGIRDVRACATVLASDGFAANPDLLAEYCPIAVEDFFGGVSTSTGDALSWTLPLGAGTRHMASFLGHGLVVAGHGTRLNPALPFRGALLVTMDGERFVDEHAHGYSSLATHIRPLPGRRAAILWSHTLHEEIMHSELMRDSERAGAFGRFDDLDALCAALGLPVAALRSTISEFEPFDEVTGQPMKLAWPLYAAVITTGILTTQGGLTVDSLGRVLTTSGTAIDGLFAGGGTAMGISGPDSTGYSSGNGLLAACGLGWNIGNHLASEV